MYQGKIDANTALEFLNKEQLLQQASSLKQQQEDKDSDVVYIGSSTDNMAVVPTQEQQQQQQQKQQQRPASSISATDRVLNELATFSEYLPLDTAKAYNSIFKRLVEIRAADSKGLHHRVIYRVSQGQNEVDEIANMCLLDGLDVLSCVSSDGRGQIHLVAAVLAQGQQQAPCQHLEARVWIVSLFFLFFPSRVMCGIFMFQHGTFMHTHAYWYNYLFVGLQSTMSL